MGVFLGVYWVSKMVFLISDKKQSGNSKDVKIKRVIVNNGK